MLNLANIKKTWYYFQKNGVSNTFYAVLERFYAKKSDLYPDRGYRYQPVSEAECERQRNVIFSPNYKISILVPMYETKPEFAREMIDSVLEQTYPHWELILADASKSTLVEETVKEYTDKRICYHRLKKNAGISENTNAALALATGDYIGLLDHDDFLTSDALFEMVSCMQAEEKKGNTVAFVYSDEDKCDTYARHYYEPNFKPEFNWDLLLSNNYICHFLIMKADLMKKLCFRGDYDGAQDFDLVLRAALFKEKEEVISHVGKVLYHWRCHEDSTAANPRSKQYAYEAGKKAAEDALYEYLKQLYQECGMEVSEGNAHLCKEELSETKSTKADGFFAEGVKVSVEHTKHNGFYRVVYGGETAEEIFKVRKDVGIIAWSMKKHGKITGGIIDKEGRCPYAGMHHRFSGYLHRNILVQQCEYVNLQNAVIREELLDIWEDKELKQDLTARTLANKELTDEALKKRDLQICSKIRERGYQILYDPLFDKRK